MNKFEQVPDSDKEDKTPITEEVKEGVGAEKEESSLKERLFEGLETNEARIKYIGLVLERGGLFKEETKEAILGIKAELAEQEDNMWLAIDCYEKIGNKDKVKELCVALAERLVKKDWLDTIDSVANLYKRAGLEDMAEKHYLGAAKFFGEHVNGWQGAVEYYAEKAGDQIVGIYSDALNESTSSFPYGLEKNANKIEKAVEYYEKANNTDKAKKIQDKLKKAYTSQMEDGIENKDFAYAAYYCEKIGLKDKAKELWIKAGERALTKSTFAHPSKAIEYYKKAGIDILSSPEYLELLAKLYEKEGNPVKAKSLRKKIK